KPRRLQTSLALLACVIAGILLAAAVWKIASTRPSLPPSRVHLKAPTELRADTGREVSFRVEMERENYDGPIQLVVDPPLPSGMLREATASAGEDFVTVSLRVEDTTPPGKQRILLRTADEALEGRATVELTIFYLPRDFEVVGTRVQTDVHGVAY